MFHGCLIATALTEMPGYKVFLQDGGDIREELTCSYCKLVLKDPVQTSESGQRFCWECYTVLKYVSCNQHQL